MRPVLTRIQKLTLGCQLEALHLANAQDRRAMQSIRRADLQNIDDLTKAPSRTVRVRANGGDIAAQSELARRLARRNKNEEALLWFRSAARSGDPERQMELGIVLFWDHAAYADGIKWVRRAAEQGTYWRPVLSRCGARFGREHPKRRDQSGSLVSSRGHARSR